MSENTNNNKNVRDDEIDLLDLFRRMGRSLGRMGNAIGRAILITIVFLFRNWLPLGLSIVLAVGASYLLKMTSPSLYTSDLVLKTNSYVYQAKPDLSQPNSISAGELISYINRLKIYCKEKNKVALADAISLSQDQVSNILDISAFWVIDKGPDGIPDFVDYSGSHNVYDTVDVRMQDRLDIRVQTKSPQEFSSLRDGIIKFINVDSLFQQRNRVRLNQNRALLSRLDYDIIQLDSLQKVKYFEETRNMQPKNGGQIIFLQEQKTQLVYTDIYNLYARKQSLEANLDLYKDIVTVLSDFTIPAVRDNGGLYYAKILIPVFFIFTLLLIIILANKKRIKEIFNKY